MNCINKYNNRMGGVGIADNPRNYYRIYFGSMNMNWWWYIFFWGAVVILTTEYVIKICIHNIHGDPGKHLLYHHGL